MLRMNDELMLVEPSEEYFAELAAYRNDFLENSDSMDGCGPLRRFDDMKAYLEDTMRYTREETLPEGMVLATQFLCIRKSDNRLVGMIQVRHYLNDFLRTFGGHIGYSVRPSERRKGYASWMLKNVQPYCKSLGLSEILVCCLDTNEGSRRTWQRFPSSEPVSAPIRAWLPKCSARSPMQESIPRWLPPQKSASLP